MEGLAIDEILTEEELGICQSGLEFLARGMIRNEKEYTLAMMLKMMVKKGLFLEEVEND